LPRSGPVMRLRVSRCNVTFLVFLRTSHLHS
jgi:hypothetical protein